VKTIPTIIGFGHLGKAFAKGYLMHNDNLNVVVKDDVLETLISQTSKINWYGEKSIDNPLRNSKIVFLAIRTDQVLSFLERYAILLEGKTVVLFQSGDIETIIQKFSSSSKIQFCRAITSINIAYSNGVTVILDSPDQALDNSVINIFDELGQIYKVKSSEELHSYSIVSAAFPALVGLFVDKMVNASIDMGVTQDYAHELVTNVVRGSVENMSSLKLSARDFCSSVCSKGGVMEELVNEFDHQLEEFSNVSKWANKLSNKLLEKED
jgi:pyrroline-5-carboxylate reductase